MYRWINKGFNYFNNKSPILILTPWSRNIGNCAEEVFYGLLKAKRESKKVLFLFHRHELFWKFRMPIANRELFNIESDYTVPNENIFVYVGGWLLTAVFCAIRIFYLCSRKLRQILRRIRSQVPAAMPFFDTGYTIPSIGWTTLWQPEDVDFFSWKIVESFNWRQQYDEYQPARLGKDEQRYTEQLRVQMGIPLTDWFVCLHVREVRHPNDPEFVDYRNASIQNYIEGIKVITHAGGWLVRIGDSSMTSLPPMEHVIDYPHTRFKSELMDLYLISQCRFYLGTNSGPYDAAVLFRKRVLTINLTEWSLAFPIRSGDLSIIKHIFSHSRGRFLSVKEILDEPFECQCIGVLSDDYVMFENTAEEIRDVIEEFLNMQENYEPSELQKAFNEGRSRQIHKWLDDGEPSWPGTKKNHVTEQYRIAARADSVAGTLGHKYLEQNWHKDRMNEE